MEKELYQSIKKHWKEVYGSASASDHALYLALLGKNALKGFSPAISTRRLNQRSGDPYGAYATALSAAGSKVTWALSDYNKAPNKIELCGKFIDFPVEDIQAIAEHIRSLQASQEEATKALKEKI
jgi:hypothetical protein